MNGTQCVINVKKLIQFFFNVLKMGNRRRNSSVLNARKKKMLKVALDTQHKYKPSPRDNDMGANYNGVNEVDIVEKYFNKIIEINDDENITFIRNNPDQQILTGNYSKRHSWVNDNNIDLYFAGHINAGKGNYGLIEVVDDKNQGKDYSNAITLSEMFCLEFTYICKVIQLKKEDRGYGCIYGVKCPGFLLEPAFLDNPEHFEKLTQGDWIGKIAKILLKFCKYYKEVD